MLQTVRGPDADGWVPLLFGNGGTGCQKPDSVFRQNSGIRWWGWVRGSSSRAKGDTIDSAVLFPVGETAASRGLPGHRILRFGFDVCEQTRMSAPPFEAFDRGIALAHRPSGIKRLSLLPLPDSRQICRYAGRTPFTQRRHPCTIGPAPFPPAFPVA